MSIALLGVFCWLGSLLAESIEGKFIHLEMTTALEGLLEESLEVIGTTLLLIAFAEHYQWRQKNTIPQSDVALSDENLCPGNKGESCEAASFGSPS